MEADTWAMEASGLRSVDGSRPEGVWFGIARVLVFSLVYT